MEEQSQRDRVLQKLLDEGEVSNFWAFHNYILRLGAIIFELRKDGYEIEGRFGKDHVPSDPSQRKNYFYILTSKPHVDVF